MSFTRRLLLGAMVALLGVAVVGCQQDDGTTGATGDSFALTSCDSADQCADGFECAAFPCPADCAADDAACATCQAGAICLPQPPAACDPEQCGPGQVCTRACSGGCDLAEGRCYDVACEATCVAVGEPTEPGPDQACVTDFTDACLPPSYPVAARLDDVCASQGMVLTDVSVAAECWPGAVQFQWTCCRSDEPKPEPYCYDECREDGLCYQTCCDPYSGQCWSTDPGQPQPCDSVCDESGACRESCWRC